MSITAVTLITYDTDLRGDEENLRLQRTHIMKHLKKVCTIWLWGNNNNNNNKTSQQWKYRTLVNSFSYIRSAYFQHIIWPLLLELILGTHSTPVVLRQTIKTTVLRKIFFSPQLWNKHASIKGNSIPSETRLTLNTLGPSTRCDADYIFVCNFNCFIMLMKIPIRGTEKQHKIA